MKEKFIPICYPESLNYMAMPGFMDNAFLINDEKGVEKYGINAYFVEEDWMLETDRKLYGETPSGACMQEKTRTWEVSVPFFLLPFVKVDAKTEQEAREKYLEEVWRRIEETFPKSAHRLLDENDEEGWNVERVYTGPTRKVTPESLGGILREMADYLDDSGEVDPEYYDEITNSGLFHDAIGKIIDENNDELTIATEY